MTHALEILQQQFDEEAAALVIRRRYRVPSLRVAPVELDREGERGLPAVLLGFALLALGFALVTPA